jgi:uncharacterized RDD family membrane protein YckC
VEQRSEGSLRRDGPGFVTPDAVGLDLEEATLGSRGIAYLLDLVVLVLGLIVLGLAQSALGGGFGFSDAFGVAALLLLLFAWQYGYPIGFEVLWRGRTPGKAAMGLRVVTVEGAPVGVRHASIRAVVATLELLGSLGLIAVVSSFASPRGQRLGDLAAGTLVVRERRSGGGEPTVERFLPPPGSEGYVSRLDVSAIGASDYAMIRDALRRARDLPPVSRDAVLAEVAAAVTPRTRPEPPAGMDAQAVLTCVAAAVQARRTPVASGASRTAGGAGTVSGAGTNPGTRRGGGEAPDPGDRSGDSSGPPPPPARPRADTERRGGFAPPD